jgi:hypothetical protein
MKHHKGRSLQHPAHVMALLFIMRRSSFEVFGLDYLVDADLNVWVLEVNYIPSMLVSLLQGLGRPSTRTQEQLGAGMELCTDICTLMTPEMR